jgi:putative phosphoribosyl transferase
MHAAVIAVKKLDPKEVIVAAPVAAIETYQEFTKLVNKIVCLHTPQNFSSVGKWYENFAQVKDDEVCELLSLSQGSGGLEKTTPPP